MKSLSLLVLGIVFAMLMTLGAANAQTGYGQGMGQGMGPAAGQGMNQSMPQMLYQKLGPADANYDLRFINLMIMHHQMAVLAGQDALQKAQHPELKQMAQSIITTQSNEIQQLQNWRRLWYNQ